jgi:hypothetical protein
MHNGIDLPRFDLEQIKKIAACLVPNQSVGVSFKESLGMKAVTDLKAAFPLPRDFLFNEECGNTRAYHFHYIGGHNRWILISRIA